MRKIELPVTFNSSYSFPEQRLGTLLKNQYTYKYMTDAVRYQMKDTIMMYLSQKPDVDMNNIDFSVYGTETINIYPHNNYTKTIIEKYW